MPVEIREIVIRAIASPDGEGNQNQSENRQSVIDKEAIVQECVRQVMNILKKKEDR